MEYDDDNTGSGTAEKCKQTGDFIEKDRLGGATCVDPHPNGGSDHDLNHAIEVSGDIVNRAVPGTYTIQYNCQDLSGNAATPVYRTIHVVDRRRPRIDLSGASYYYIEAGFPYSDAGASATDDLDGDISARIETDGDVVDTSAAFYERRSCNDIYETHQKHNGLTHASPTSGATATTLTSGDYWITTVTSGVKERTQVWCDFTSAPTQHTYTYLVKNSGTPVQQLGAATQPNVACPDGMSLYNWEVNPDNARYQAVKTHFNNQHGLECTSSSQEVTSYTCTMTAASDRNTVAKNERLSGTTTRDLAYNHLETRATNHELISHTAAGAETGKYIVRFYVKDKANNDEISTKFRTVVVRDTLAPVITLHDTITGKLLDVSATAKSGQGLGYEANPAGLPRVNGEGNPFLVDQDNVNALTTTYTTEGNGPAATGDFSYMAEESQVTSNGWVIAAAASGITGIALLAAGQRKAAITTVPV